MHLEKKLLSHIKEKTVSLKRGSKKWVEEAGGRSLPQAVEKVKCSSWADTVENDHKSVMIRTFAHFFSFRFPHYLGTWNRLIKTWRNFECHVEQKKKHNILPSLRKQTTFCDATNSFSAKDVWETSAEIPYWWRVTTQIWVELLIGWSKFHKRHNQSEALPRSG